jgi:hypothetical protein
MVHMLTLLLLLLCCTFPAMPLLHQACFAALRSRLSQASLDDFGLGQASDLNPLLPDGLLGQMHASNLLGALQVVMEDVVADVQQLKDEQPDAASRVSMRPAVASGGCGRLRELLPANAVAGLQCVIVQSILELL